MKLNLFFISTFIIIGNTFSVNAQVDSLLLGRDCIFPASTFAEDRNPFFVETPPPGSPVRGIAEFEPMQGVLIRHTYVPIELVRELAKDILVTTIVSDSAQRNSVLQLYASSNIDTSNCDFLLINSKGWTRDFGPWYISDSSNKISIVDVRYFPERPLDDSIPKILASRFGVDWYGMNLFIEGGNYMTDGMGTAACSDYVFDENPFLTPEQVKSKFHNYLGLDSTYIFKVNDLKSLHIDCWGKFLSPDKILIRKVQLPVLESARLDSVAAFFSRTLCSYGYPYKVYRIQCPNKQPYVNSLILNNKVLVPLVNSDYDDSALMIYRAAMPGYNVVGINSNTWSEIDALHCRAIGLADIGMLQIRHIPINGELAPQPNFLVEANIIPSSGLPVYPDSLFTIYKVNSGSYDTIVMSFSGGFHYFANIPAQLPGSRINYYLAATDHSGRHSFAPYVGKDDPFTFQLTINGIENPVVKENPILHNPCPNPFNEIINISFAARIGTHAEIVITNILGRRIANLFNGNVQTPDTSLTWNGKDDSGNALPAGIYFCNLYTNLTSISKRMILLK